MSLGRQVVVGGSNALCEEIMLLWCFNISDYSKKRTKSTILAPLLHESLRVLYMFRRVIVRLFVLTKEQSLPNKIDCMAAAAEASVRWVEVVIA